MPEHDVTMKRQQVLANFGEFAMQSEDLDEVLGHACRLVAEALGGQRSQVLEIQQGGTELLLRASFGWQQDVTGKLRIPMDERSCETFSINAAEPVSMRDIAHEERFDIPDFVKDAGTAAFVNVPIFLPGARTYGILQVDSIEPRDFLSDDLQFLRTCATIVGPVIARLQRASERLADDKRRSADLAAMEELQRVSSELVGEHAAQSHFRRIVEAACVLMRSDAASIQLLNAGCGRLNLVSWQGLDAGSAEIWEWVRTDARTSSGRALRAGERIVVPDVDLLESSAENVQAYRLSNIRSVQSTPLRAFNGQIVGMLSTHWHDRHEPAADDYRYFDVLARLAADLVERLQAQEKLRQSEERLREFGEASQDVLWVRDTATMQWRYLTPAFEAVYGMSREEILSGDNYASWLDLVVPEDRPLAQDAMQRLRRGERVTFDYRIRRPADGAVRWIRDTDFPIADPSGEITAFGGVGHDLTDFRETELRLQTLVDGIPQLVWRAVNVGQWTWASEQWTSFTGQAQADSHGWGWLDPLHPDDRDTAREAWSTAIERGGFAVKLRIRHAASQSYRWFQTRATPARDRNGSIVEWLGTSTDIDELRNLQARQQVLVTELQHRTFNLMGLVRSMADETVRSSASLQDFKHKFRDRIDALARVQRLLSRLSDGERISFDALIRSELSAVGALSEGDARVSLNGPSGVALRSSTVQIIAMAIHELTTNAVKYGALKDPAGHLDIAWRLDRPDGDGKPWLHVDWRETGVTMPLASAEPHGTGQGRALIEEALPYQLNARTTYVMAPDGVKCSIALSVMEQGWEGSARE